MKEIIEISAPDYTGKSTQADMLAMETLGKHAYNFGSFEGYGTGVPGATNPQEHFAWWFETSSFEDMTELLVTAYDDRESQAMNSHVDIPVYERGRMMMRAQLAANFATRNDEPVANYLDQAGESLDAALAHLDSSIPRTEVLLVPNDEWREAQRKYTTHARTMKTASSVFTDQQNEFYSRYLENLNEAIALLSGTDGLVKVDVDAPAVDVNNRIRRGALNGLIPDLLPQNPTVLGFAGLSESGKSGVAEKLATEHGFTRLKLGFFNEAQRGSEKRYARPSRIAMDVLHFLATNRHLDKVTFESLHGPEVSSELKLLIGERWKPVYIRLDEASRQRRLAEQFPDSDMTALLAQQSLKDSGKRDAGVEQYEAMADIIVDNNGTLDETVQKILEGVNHEQ